MSIQKPIFLKDLIRQVAESMSLSLSPILAQDKKGYNVEFDRIADSDLPCLCYNIEQRGVQRLQNTGKIYLEYSPSLVFLTLGDQDDIFDAQDRIEQMQLVAIEFMQRFIRLESWGNVPENQEVQPSFRELANVYDTWMSGVELSFTFVHDPNIQTPKC